MTFAADYEILFDHLDGELQAALRPARDLFGKIIASACKRIPLLSRSGRVHRIEKLIEAEAWTECALTLIELELPGLKLRRLAYENGEWLCSLTRQPNLPLELDDTIDARHDVQALAILRAFVEARRCHCSEEPQRSQTAASLCSGASTMCCDNFS